MTQRGDRTKARLVRAATELVAELGPARATTRAIAARAGVSEATIYRHFPDKRTLFMAGVLAGHEPLMSFMGELPSLAGTSTLTDNLVGCLVRMSTLKDSVLPLERALMDDPGPTHGHTPTDPALIMASGSGPPHHLERYLAAEQELGRVSADVDTAEAAITLLALLYGLGSGPQLPGRSLERSIDAAVRLVVQGIAT